MAYNAVLERRKYLILAYERVIIIAIKGKMYFLKSY